MPENPKNDFYEKCVEIVRTIPPGKVTTYGAIAKAIGIASAARTVGWALNASKNDTSAPFHRVVNRNGELTGKMHFATPSLMRELLENEGVSFRGDAVDMEKHFHDPSE